MTPGEALRILDVPKEDFPNAKTWDAMNEAERFRYERRASDVLELARKILDQMASAPAPDAARVD